MVQIGKLNTLRIVKEVDAGFYLDGDELGEILLPGRYRPKDAQVGDSLEVFIYLDSEDRLIATTQKPRAYVGEFATLQVKQLTPVGAFLDWGLEKDLLLPFGESKQRLQEGRNYLVYLYLDNSERICASNRVDRYLDNAEPHYHSGEEVNLLIADKTDLGYKAIVNNSHWGILYENELFRTVRFGYRTKGYIKKVRPDGKIDLSLEQPTHARLDQVSELILKRLLQNGGFLPLHDKSSPDAIKNEFGISKKLFKNAIGTLYKQQLIRIEGDGIHLP